MDMVKTPSPLSTLVNVSRNGSSSPPSQHTSESDPDTPQSSEPNTPCNPDVDFALHQFERSAKILQLSDWFLRSDCDVDFDAILGELCELETQINTQQTQLGDNAGPPPSGSGESVAPRQPPPATRGPGGDLYTEPVKVKKTGDHSSQDAGNKSRNSDGSMDAQLESALSELSGIMSTAFDGQEVGNTRSPRGKTMGRPESEDVESLEEMPPKMELLCRPDMSHQRSLSNNSVDGSTRTLNGHHGSHRNCQSLDHGYHSDGRSHDYGTHDGRIYGHQRSRSLHHQHMDDDDFEDGFPDSISEWRDTVPDGLDTDSAFSDTISLPSSGSHISVTTTSSQNSGSSTGSSGIAPSPPSTDHANRIKAEKVRLALEKIKEANIRKLFVRAYTCDGSSKSILVDEKMTVAQVCDILVAKNHAIPTLNWSVVEQMPELYMERMLEDHDNLVDNLLMWARDSTNRLVFVERPDKFAVFLRPEEYLLPGVPESKVKIDCAGRQALIQEYFHEGSTRVPEMEGMLYLKSEGKKAWKRFYFVLRASGLYYNPKGKSKSSRDLVCLQQLDFIDVYFGVGWKKKYKAPSDYCFALKHPQIQKKASKYIRYLCADDCRTLHQWVMAIRVAKHGRQLLVNFESVRNAISTWDKREYCQMGPGDHREQGPPGSGDFRQMGPGDHRQMGPGDHRQMGPGDHRHMVPAAYGTIGDHRQGAPAEYRQMAPADHRQMGDYGQLGPPANYRQMGSLDRQLGPGEFRQPPPDVTQHTSHYEPTRMRDMPPQGTLRDSAPLAAAIGVRQDSMTLRRPEGAVHTLREGVSMSGPEHSSPSRAIDSHPPHQPHHQRSASTKMNPLLPVTTEITRQITGQHAESMKRSPQHIMHTRRPSSSESTTMLPPPPLSDTHSNPDICSSSNADLPPPPSPRTLGSPRRVSCGAQNNLYGTLGSGSRRMSDQTGIVSPFRNSPQQSPIHSPHKPPLPPISATTMPSPIHAVSSAPCFVEASSPPVGPPTPPVAPPTPPVAPATPPVAPPTPPVAPPTPPIMPSTPPAAPMAPPAPPAPPPAPPTPPIATGQSPQHHAVLQRRGSSGGETSPVRPTGPVHRRTGSGGGSAAKPPPPPPPKRSMQTKLSMHGESSGAGNFMADLQRALSQKQSRGSDSSLGDSSPQSPPILAPGPKSPPPATLPKSSAVAAHGSPLHKLVQQQIKPAESMSELPPPPPNAEDSLDGLTDDELEDLPPPPPELLEGLPAGPPGTKKKPPPPPPKRSQGTSLSRQNTIS